VVYLIVLPRYVCKITDCSLAKYFRESFFPPLLNSIPFAGLLCIFKIYLQPASWMVFALEISAALAVYGVTALFLCFSGPQRSIISDVVVNRLRKAAPIG